MVNNVATRNPWSRRKVTVPRPSSPFDNTSQSQAWARGLEAGFNQGLLPWNSGEAFRIGHQAGLAYRRTLNYYGLPEVLW